MVNRIRVHAERCTGCRLCELACSLEKVGEFNPKLSGIRVRFKGEGSCIPVVCTQCEYEWCMKACPVGAISRDPETLVVRIDPDDCIGCGQCVLACPIGAISHPIGDATPIKCDMCGGQPACVLICPTEVLSFVCGNGVG